MAPKNYISHNPEPSDSHSHPGDRFAALLGPSGLAHRKVTKHDGKGAYGYRKNQGNNGQNVHSAARPQPFRLCPFEGNFWLLGKGQLLLLRCLGRLWGKRYGSCFAKDSIGVESGEVHCSWGNFWLDKRLFTLRGGGILGAHELRLAKLSVVGFRLGRSCRRFPPP